MALPPIQVSLTKFEQIEILRAEIDLREKELHETDKQIRKIMFENERQKYLQGIHPAFQQLSPPEGMEQLAQLNLNRETLGTACEALRAALGALEAETGGPSAPRAQAASPAAGAASRRPKFDSFEKFGQNKPLT
jgi:hypothetical protein